MLCGSGCNTLSHEGLTNVNTRKRMFYPLDIATDTVQRTRLRTPLILRTIAPQTSTMLQTGIHCTYEKIH